jgi:hypothetical protein
MDALMTRLATILGLAITASIWIGCNKSADAPPTADSNASSASDANAQAPQQTARKPVEVAVEAAPEQVVSTFLAALKAGDEATTAALLTSKAREETAKHEIAVAPQSAPGATYQVSQGQILADNPDGAHVNSVWTETYPDGTITYEIVWVLRRQPDGWRIAGMALELIPGQPPQFLNFENPQDMMKKHEEAIAAQDLAAQQAAASTAQAPAETQQEPQTLQR